ncbi:MAG: hypothetical protein JJU01_09915 [Alkalibacterium sp.]|nr:hypothetical protein [Alkalibacterium sp.]
MNKSCKIKRDPVFFKGNSLLTIYINEEEVDRLSAGEEKSLSFTTEQASLRVARFGEGSNTLQISEGDSVRVEITPWAIWVYLLKLLVIPVFLVYFELFSPLTSLILMIALFTLSNMLLKPFKLLKESD